METMRINPNPRIGATDQNNRRGSQLSKQDEE
jgi:hypothetical protein